MDIEIPLPSVYTYENDDKRLSDIQKVFVKIE
jgi:hypothetical protein